MNSRKLTDIDGLMWAFLSLALALAGIHFYLGFFAPFVPDARSSQFVLIGLAFLVGLIVFFTTYWPPALYLVGAVFALSLGVLWVLGGMEYFQFGVLTGLTAIGFVLLALVLFLRDETRTAGT